MRLRNSRLMVKDISHHVLNHETVEQANFDNIFRSILSAQWCKDIGRIRKEPSNFAAMNSTGSSPSSSRNEKRNAVHMEQDIGNGGRTYITNGNSNSKGKRKIRDHDDEPDAAQILQGIAEKINNEKDIVINDDNDNKKKTKNGSRSSKGKEKMSDDYRPRRRVLVQEPAEQEPVQTLPQEILEKIQVEGEDEPVLLFRKTLTQSDLKPGQNRILVTGSGCDKMLEGLTEQERGTVEDIFDTSGICVTTIDPMGNEYELHLKKWPSSKSVVLNHEWKKLFMANGLNEGDRVQGWGYRVNSEFRIAIKLYDKSG